jgi:hypothetical protein
VLWCWSDEGHVLSSSDVAVSTGLAPATAGGIFGR